MYVAEIVPPVESAIEAFESGYIPDTVAPDIETPPEPDEEEKNQENIQLAPLKGFVQRATFTGLKKGVKYKIKVRTVINGKTICKVSEDIPDRISYFGL